jgi:hypothetical protein
MHRRYPLRSDYDDNDNPDGCAPAGCGLLLLALVGVMAAAYVLGAHLGMPHW